MATGDGFTKIVCTPEKSLLENWAKNDCFKLKCGKGNFTLHCIHKWAKCTTYKSDVIWKSNVVYHGTECWPILACMTMYINYPFYQINCFQLENCPSITHTHKNLIKDAFLWSSIVNPKLCYLENCS